MGARPQDHMFAAQIDEFRYPQPGLHCSQQKGSVPSSAPGRLVRSLRKSIDLFTCKEFDGSSLKAFAWDGKDSIAEFGVCWLTERDVSEE